MSRENGPCNPARLAFLAKPIPSHDLVDRLLDRLSRFIARPTRNVLVFEPNLERRKKLVECIEGKEVQIETADDVPSRDLDPSQRTC